MISRILKRWLLSALLGMLLGALGGELSGQQAGRQLTLAEAIELARRNNPNFLMQANDQSGADWGVRSAYASLLPSAGVSGGLSYRKAGVTRIDNLDFGVQGTDYLSSSYNLGFSWRLDGGTLFALPSAEANADATEARIDNALFNLESSVTLQYMSALRARDGLDVARRRMERARRNAELVRARVDAGASAGWEGKQAEVELGRAEVAILQSERAFRTEKLRLMEQLGVNLGDDISLVSEFEVFQPTWSLESLLERALSAHPSLRAELAQERAARATVRQAKSLYFPSLSLSTGFSGSTIQAMNEDFLLTSAESSRSQGYDRCLQWQAVGNRLGVTFPGYSSCGSPTLSEEQTSQLLSGNQVFPFDFTKNPLTFSANVSMPIFNSFNRERQVSQALSSAKDAEYGVRAEELRIRTAVTDQVDVLTVAYKVVEIEARNREVAEERLTLAQQRYSLGAAGIIELLDAETSMSSAEGDYLNAVYQFHHALVALEAATGGSLRAESR